MKSRILLAGIVLALSVVMGRPIQAQTSACDTVVIDDAQVFGDGISRVQDAADKLMKLGADVRVRTIQTDGDAGNLDNYADRVMTACASWRGPDGNYKNNMIAVFVSMEHEDGLFVGDDWKDSIGPNWKRIEADLMAPKFSEGDFAGGFVSGMEEIARLVNLQVHPPTAVPQQQVPNVVVIIPTTQQEVRSETPPPDLSGLWNVLLWIVGLAILGLAGYYAFKAVTKYLEILGKTRVAQQKAKIQKVAAASRVNTWDGKLQPVQAKLADLQQRVAPGDLQPITSQVNTSVQIANQAAEKFYEQNHSAGDPNVPRLTIQEYLNIAGAFEDILQDMGKAEGILSQAEMRIDQLVEYIAQAPKAVEKLQGLITGAETHIQTIAGKGYKVEKYLGVLSEAKKSLAEVQKAIAAKKYGLAMKLANTTSDQVAAAVGDAESLPQKIQALQNLLRQVKTRNESVKSAIAAGKAIFDAITSQYAETLWNSIKGNGTEATKRVISVDTAIPTVEQYLKMEVQEFDQAETLLKQMVEALDQADSYMRSISSLQDHLKELRRSAPSEILSAQNDIKAAEAYIEQYDPDIAESLEKDLVENQQLLDTAREMLKQETPNYVQIVKIAQKANSVADNILAEARSEHEAAERKRAKAKSALRDAGAVVSRAEEYIEDHRSDVSRSTMRKLTQAQVLLSQAKEETDLDMQVEIAGKAETLADSAYESAESEFHDAEEARRPVYTPPVVVIRDEDHGSYHPSHHRDDSGPSIPSISHSSGGSSSWGSPISTPHVGGVTGGSSHWSPPPSSPSPTHVGGVTGGSSHW